MTPTPGPTTDQTPDPDAERRLLCAHLDAHRRHALSSVDGLSELDLRRPVLPSGWSCLGMISHLTWDVETFWFAAVVSGDQLAVEALAERNAWQVEERTPAEQILSGYRAAIERSEQIIASTALDTAPTWWPGDLFGDFRMRSLREILLHTISECACHAGHLDAARELIDGHQHLVLT